MRPRTPACWLPGVNCCTARRGRPIPNQPGRRSLVPCQGPELALTLKPLQAAKGGAANVSHDTIRKAEVVQERGDPRLIVQARRGADDIHDFVS